MPLTVEGRPKLAADCVLRAVRELYGIEGSLRPLPAEWDQNFRLDSADGRSFVVKIANRGRGLRLLQLENAAMEHLSRRWPAARSPRVLPTRSGSLIAEIEDGTGAGHALRLLTWIPGRPLSSLEPARRPLEDLGEILGEMDSHLAEFRHPAMRRRLRWDLDNAGWIGTRTGRIRNLERRGRVERILLQYRGRIAPEIGRLRRSVIHNDANDENVLVAPAPSGGWSVAGIVDFGDMLHSSTVNELAIAAAYATLGSGHPLEAIASMAAGYHRARKLEAIELEALFPLTCVRLCVSVVTSAMAAREDPDNAHRLESEAPAWEQLERLSRIDWREASGCLKAACGLDAATSGRPPRDRVRAETLLGRRAALGPSLSLVYEEPLLLEAGRGAYLFERGGSAYLDCVNNVCHVGHCHPAVVEALSGAAAKLNTNTRYLHPDRVEYAKRLTATFPAPLSVCFFVSSGSEANDLAVRMAREYTGRLDVIVIEDAYHGNTQTLIDLSPYKCEGPGGHGLASWAHKVAKPDAYRGAHRGAGVGSAYARDVTRTCRRLVEEGRPPAAFLCESILGCGGQVVLPEGYLEEVFREVRAEGGLCVVDEVQVGFGRTGTHMWAFETQGVVPDIVTLGKPMGNGHPIGAVVTTPAIASAFASGMEFFSTFGGNTVSAAVGLAVLDVIQRERLRENAARVGAYLRDGFLSLARRRSLVGDVRGLGLFLGVELVRDRLTLEPATEETGRLVEHCKSEGVLLAAEGPFHNVLKIKPPLVFGMAEADLLLGAVDRALELICPA